MSRGAGSASSLVPRRSEDGSVLSAQRAVHRPLPGRPDFFEAVWELVKAVPPGCVTTYGWLARRLGRPQHARLVGYALHGALGDEVPCHRVVNHQGRLSGAPHFAGPGQRALLEAEGVSFKPDGGVDLRRHLWHPPAPGVEASGADADGAVLGAPEQ